MSRHILENTKIQNAYRAWTAEDRNITLAKQLTELRLYEIGQEGLANTRIDSHVTDVAS